jgi:phosphoglucomutase
MIDVRELWTLIGANTVVLSFVGGTFFWLLRPHFNKAVIGALRVESGAWQELAREVFKDDYARVEDAQAAAAELSDLIKDLTAEVRQTGMMIGNLSRTMESLTTEVHRNSEAVARIQGLQQQKE